MKSSDFETTSSSHRGKLNSGQWTLCVGAGISRGIVPTWFEFTRKIVNESFGSSLSNDEFRNQTNELGWSLDSWIQTSLNEFRIRGRRLAEFHELLSVTLYGDILRKARSVGFERHLKIALKNPRQVQKERTVELGDFLEDQYGDTSLFRLAKLLIKCAKSDKLPYAIITFNADTLLHTAIELIQRRDHFLGPPPHSHPQYYFKSIMRGLGGVPQKKVPIIHIHGAIKPEVGARVTKGDDSRDMLVFLEEDYLKVASNSSSWPEVTFVYHSQISRLVFFGLSMSDSNIRRWLSSSNKIVAHDLRRVAGIDEYTPSNVWITSKPVDPLRAQILSAGVSHLGVRVGWISGWSEIDAAFSNLLAL